MTSQFLRNRQRLVAVAARIVGSWSDAEDVVQDAWLRWHSCDHDAVVDPTAYLVTMTTRLAINVNQSARVRRESTRGTWRTEPVDGAEDLTVGAERSEAVAVGLLLLLERLGPVERAAYLLRHAFDYPYPRIAELLTLSEANARQIVSRAGRRLGAERQRPVEPSEQLRHLHAFLSASLTGDLGPLEALLVTAVRPT